MEVKDLSPNLKNPRKISDAKLAQLKKALAEFGDLGGFVFNRKSKQIVSGHQRAKLFDGSAKITIEKKYSKPTTTGTVAEGFIEFNGERFKYREVSWTDQKEKAANIAANKGAGEWDHELLGEWLQELEESHFDLDLTMFDAPELSVFGIGDAEEVKKSAVGSKEYSEKEFQEFSHQCPKCGFEFNSLGDDIGL